MAKQPATKETSKGICNFCKGEFEKAKMTQHLKYCKQRTLDIAAETSAPIRPARGEASPVPTGFAQAGRKEKEKDSSKSQEMQKTKLFHLVVEGRYNPQYWMHLEIPASDALADLDGFLRDIWLECCGHLSAFEIGGTSYSNEPEDFSFEIVGAEVQEEQEEEDDEDEDEEEYEDLSPEELAEEIGKFLDEEPPEWRKMLPRELQKELRKPRSRDDLVAFLKERLNSMPKRISLFPSENAEEQRSLYFQKNTLELLLDMVEDRSLYVSLEKVLKVGQKFTHEYDFGSTTHLVLKVVGEREGIVQDKDEDNIEIMARNLPPTILCVVCGKPAKRVGSSYYDVEENAYCSAKCAKKNGQYYEEMLPIVNSPRVGVCGYTG